jgi:hypothetical protein
MKLSVDYKRGKLIDYWAEQNIQEKCTEEEMESKMDKLAEMSSTQIDNQYKRLILHK